jgi:hypothetical protein
MKRKYYLKTSSGHTKIFGSFNQLLRYLKLTEEQQLKLADQLGTLAFTGNKDIDYINNDLGFEVSYR